MNQQNNIFRPIGRTQVVVPQGGNGMGECNDACNKELAGMSLAMVYSPYQEFEALFEPHEGLHAGTIFQALEKPFFGARRVK